MGTFLFDLGMFIGIIFENDHAKFREKKSCMALYNVLLSYAYEHVFPYVYIHEVPEAFFFTCKYRDYKVAT